LKCRSGWGGGAGLVQANLWREVLAAKKKKGMGCFGEVRRCGGAMTCVSGSIPAVHEAGKA